ncbi:hypothetical protein [Bacillus altitudinis]|uniref:hypothetical protein n=1 Tax=Bacillus altitudinis TaxID=293387 RepID=UPI002281CE77|nr:hypothetical protein [Bacillus altitudinis]MCY7439699.1 hypothetical protein [Bacillus altitudinis]MEC1142013.1 hypothetical protein [Bacillus altitudinis]
MNWMELLSSIINSIAWPMAIVLIIRFLKKPITDLINNIITIKYKDLEITRSADSVENKTNNIVGSEDFGKEISLAEMLSNYRNIEQLNAELDKNVLDLYSVSIDPRRDISMNEPSHQLQSTSYLASYLKLKGIISNDIYEVICELKNLYDKIHFVDNKTLEYPKKKYQENATKIIAVLDNKIKEIQSMASLS